MDYTIMVLLLVTVAAAANNSPKVYEEEQSEKYHPQVFNFQEYKRMAQQNPMMSRYQQQQVADKKHSQQQRQAKFLVTKPDQIEESSNRETLSKSPTSNWKIIHPKFVVENLKEAKAEEALNETENAKNASDYNKIRREDTENDYYAPNPKILQQTLGGFAVYNQDTQLDALSSLIGKNPNVQLQGLQNLLNEDNFDRDHTPIKEDVVDVPNVQMRPNIKVQHRQVANETGYPNVVGVEGHPEALKSIQAQLDARANAHAQNILAEAQQKALQHVQAQHEAIAKAQKEAERQAFIKINAHNNALRAHAAMLTQEKPAAQEIATEKPIVYSNNHIALNDPVQYSHVQPEILYNPKPKYVLPPNAYQPAPTIQIPTKNIIREYRPVIRQPTKPIFRQLQQASHQKELYALKDAQYFSNPENSDEGKGGKDFQYASKYAFAYRIHDFENGNDYGHREAKDGDTTKGHYHVLLPDGRVQNVDYVADATGYHAKVTYGEAAS